MDSKTSFTKTQAPLPRPPVIPPNATIASAKPKPPLPPNAKSSPSRYLALLLLLIAGIVCWFGLRDSRPNRKVSQRQNLRQIDSLVNRNLQMTNQKIEMAQEQVRLKNFREEIPVVGQQIQPRWRPQELGGVDHSVDRSEQNAARDLSSPVELNMGNPNAVIQSELADSQAADQAAEDSIEAREAYAQQFIENARRGGYDVKLDRNNRVISVRRLNDGSDGEGRLSNQGGSQ